MKTSKTLRYLLKVLKMLIVSYPIYRVNEEGKTLYKNVRLSNTLLAPNSLGDVTPAPVTVPIPHTTLTLVVRFLSALMTACTLLLAGSALDINFCIAVLRALLSN